MMPDKAAAEQFLFKYTSVPTSTGWPKMTHFVCQNFVKCPQNFIIDIN